MWPSDATMQAKCKQSLPGAPWTLVGAALRGIPFTGNIIASDLPPVPQPVAKESGLFGIPNTVMFIGLGVLGLGGAALLMSKKKRASVAGYRRGRKH